MRLHLFMLDLANGWSDHLFSRKITIDIGQVLGYLKNPNCKVSALLIELIL